MTGWREALSRYRFSVVELCCIAWGVHLFILGHWMLAFVPAVIGGIAQALLESRSL